MRRLLVCLLVTHFFPEQWDIATAQSSVPDDAIGIVAANIRGRWVCEKDGRVLVPGDTISRQSTVSTEHSTTNSIKVALFDGQVWSKTCSPSAPCDGGGYRIPDSNEGTGSFLIFIRAFPAVREKIATIFTASRALTTGGPNEAILELEQRSVNLLPALGQLEQGRWQVTLSDPNQPRELGFTQALTFPKEHSLTGVAYAPGIYALEVESEELGKRGGLRAAVLLVKRAGSDTPKRQFDEALRVSSKWMGIDAATKRTFLVQCLYAIQRANS